MSAAPAATRYACGAAARLWPFLLAVALPAGALVAVLRVDHAAATLPGWSTARLLVLLVALAAAVAVVRLGAPLRATVIAGAEQLELLRGRHRRRLPYDAIAQLGWEPAGSTRRALVSSMIVEPEQGGPWRVPALIPRGDALVRELARRSGREDVTAWCEALRLERRMGRSAIRVVACYLVLAGWIAAVALFVLR